MTKNELRRLIKEVLSEQEQQATSPEQTLLDAEDLKLVAHLVSLLENAVKSIRGKKNMNMRDIGVFSKAIGDVAKQFTPERFQTEKAHVATNGSASATPQIGKPFNR